MPTEKQRWKWWRYNEMFALLDIWSKPPLRVELDGTKRNSYVYTKIAVLLASRGIKRSANQVREKMKTLKRAYVALSLKNKSELEGKKLMLFERLDEILGQHHTEAATTTDGASSAATSAIPLVVERRSQRQVAHQNYSDDMLEDIIYQDDTIDDINYGSDNDAADNNNKLEDDKQALHLLLAMGDNPCQLQTATNKKTSNESNNEDNKIRILTVSSEAATSSGSHHHQHQIMSHHHVSDSSRHQEQDVLLSSTILHVCPHCGHSSEHQKCNSETIKELKKTLSTFLTAQTQAERRFVALEEQRMKEEKLMFERQQEHDRDFIEKIFHMEDKRRNEDREHETKLYALLASRINGIPTSCPLPPAPQPSVVPMDLSNWEFSGTFRPSSTNSDKTK